MTANTWGEDLRQADKIIRRRRTLRGAAIALLAVLAFGAGYASSQLANPPCVAARAQP
jgi:hypothetical protein